MYYLIFVSEDGGISVKEYTKEGLLSVIKDEDYGHLEFIEKLEESDPQYWGDKNALIIEGKIVVLKKIIKAVIEYEI